MRTSANTRTRKLASVGTAGLLILAMSGVAAVADEADPAGGDVTAGETEEPGSGEGGSEADPGDGDGGETDPGGEDGGEGGHEGGGGGGHEGGGGGGHEGGGGGGHQGGGPPNRPEPQVVETVLDEVPVCSTLDMTYQLQTVTTVYVWQKGAWVLGESTTEVADLVRDLTADEIEALCPSEEPPGDDGETDDGDTDDGDTGGGGGAVDEGDTDEVAGVETTVPAAAPDAEVLGVEAAAPTAAVPTSVDAGLGAPASGGPLGPGLMGAGAALMALAGALALGRRVSGEHVR